MYHQTLVRCVCNHLLSVFSSHVDGYTSSLWIPSGQVGVLRFRYQGSRLRVQVLVCSS
ncbi:hypothetical protein M8C21_027066 [Ambrosia artemisiifolia]|uniref:Uncharacterized protein n=1 Tax=Ambrosia artemisiifolia TaxID=4212 RepID=A0AAD5CP77_AMBAR|nr:hypothetical protein M8C21_027066 [Ambrosia artemisiifolia]